MSILPNGGGDMSFKVSWKVHLICLISSYAICFKMKDTIVNVITDLFINNEILSITNNFLID